MPIRIFKCILNRLRWFSLMGVLVFIPFNSDGYPKKVVHTMTVIAVRPPRNDVPYLEVVFAISQRIYKLPTNCNPRYLKLLRASAREHSPVVVTRADEYSDIILKVEKPKDMIH